MFSLLCFVLAFFILLMILWLDAPLKISSIFPFWRNTYKCFYIFAQTYFLEPILRLYWVIFLSNPRCNFLYERESIIQSHRFFWRFSFFKTWNDMFPKHFYFSLWAQLNLSRSERLLVAIICAQIRTGSKHNVLTVKLEAFV